MCIQLIAPFSSLSIESHGEEEVVQSGAVKIPKEHPFYHSTMRLQGNSKIRSHGSVWECLVAIDKYLKKAKLE